MIYDNYVGRRVRGLHRAGLGGGPIVGHSITNRSRSRLLRGIRKYAPAPHNAEPDSGIRTGHSGQNYKSVTVTLNAHLTYRIPSRNQKFLRNQTSPSIQMHFFDHLSDVDWLNCRLMLTGPQQPTNFYAKESIHRPPSWPKQVTGGRPQTSS